MVTNKYILNLPSKNSTGSYWIEWHTALKRRFGKKTANQLFTMAWEKRGSSDAKTTELLKYLDNNEVNIETSALENLDLSVANAFDFVGGIFDFSTTISKVMVVIVVIGAGMIIYNVARKPVETLNAVASARTGGALPK